MKRLILFLFFTATVLQQYAQLCPVCTIDLSCDSVPAGPKLCPSELPQGTAGQIYEGDLTFFIPQQFQHPQYGTITLNQIDILGVTGLPAGMSWSAYNYQGAEATSFFPAENPPSSERGCAKICGTPPMPFDDSISVTVVVHVSVSGIDATQNSTFKVHLKIIPNPSGNSVFTMDNSQGCGSVSVNFSPNLQSFGNPLITYYWDFGNGETGYEEFPAKTYQYPGDFTVTCTTTVYQYVINYVTASSENDDWCGDIEEPYIFGCIGSPDMFFQINSNGGIAGSDTISGNSDPSWSNLYFPIEGTDFIIYFFDADQGPPLGSNTDSLGYGTITVSGSGGTYYFSIPSKFGNGEVSVAGYLEVSLQVKDTYIDSDLVQVHAAPDPGPISVYENDSICSGDSVFVFVDDGFTYQWYNDTALLFGENEHYYTVKQNGSYWVLVTDSFGCKVTSNIQKVTIIPNPPKPSFAYMGNNTLKTFLSGYSLQWYFDGTALPGETSQTCIIDSSGYYGVTASNGLCTSYSDKKYYTYSGVGNEEINNNSTLKIFPNPNKGEFTLLFESDILTDVEISVTDVLGREVFYKSQKEVPAIYSENINLIAAGAGIYSLKLTAGNFTVNRKIIVQ